MSKRNLIKLVLVPLICIFFAVVWSFSAKSTLWDLDLNMEPVQILNGWTKAQNQNAGFKGAAVERYFDSQELESISGGPTILFTTVNQRVRVYADRRMIYSFGYNGMQYAGSESGPSLHIVRLPHVKGESVTVQLAMEPAVAWMTRLPQHGTRHGYFKMPQVFFGSKAACMSHYFMSCLNSAVPSLFILGIGILYLYFFLGFWISRRQRVMDYLYWGAFAVVCGLGLMLEEGVFLTTFPNAFELYFLSTFIVALEPRLFLMYLDSSRIITYNETAAKILRRISLGACPVVCMGALLQNIPFVFFRVAACILLLITLIFMFAAIWNEIFTVTGRVTFLTAVMLLADLTIMVDLVCYGIWPERTELFRISKYGMLVFFLVNSIQVINDFYENEMQTARVSMLEKSAYSDIQTGCRNNAALWRVQKEVSPSLKMMAQPLKLAEFDIANLKALNDKAGSAAGDDAIKTLAQLLLNVFNSDDVYRTGGGRFIVLLQNTPEEDAQHRVQSVVERLGDMNQKGIITFCVAYGYGEFDRLHDKDFDGFLTRIEQGLIINTELKS